MIGDDACNAMNCMRARLIRPELWPESVTRFHKAWCQWKKDNDLIDFTDMLELALENQIVPPGNPDVIFADEAQDFSALEMALLQKWGRKAGRLVVVGDPWQALYEWRGSDADVFYRDVASDERVLGQSYRVPRAVHGAAMRWIQQMPGYRPIEYHPTEKDGSVAGLDATYKDFSGAMRLVEGALADDKSVMILASCAYMLTPVIKQLRDAGIPFKNDYRRKNGAWNPLIRRGHNVSSADRLVAFMHMADEGFWTKQDLITWLSGANCSAILPNKQSFKKFEPILQNLNDGEIPYGLAEALLGVDTVECGISGALDWYVNTLNATRREAASFPCRIVDRHGTGALRDSPRVTIGTVHSVKGGESDVVIIAPDLSMRGVETWSSGPEGRASIYRLMYVALTRAKESVHIMNPVSAAAAVRLI
jgi:DNA helicase-2/ATP-dependent DNA helicase PcrA